MFHYLYIVLFCSFIHGHLGRFRLLAAVSMGVQISKYPDMELLDSYGNTVFHSSCFYIPASDAQRFQFLHIFTNTCLLSIPTSPHPYPLAHRPTHLTVAIFMGALLSLKLDQWVGCAEPCGGHICSATTPDAYYHLGPRLQSCEPPTCLLKPACVLSPSSCSEIFLPRLHLFQARLPSVLHSSQIVGCCFSVSPTHVLTVLLSSVDPPSPPHSGKVPLSSQLACAPMRRAEGVHRGEGPGIRLESWDCTIRRAA